MKGIRPVNIFYIIPYLALIALGIWYRLQIAPIAFLNGDSGNYLMPAYVKALAHVWHKGERPMQYLQFIYLTLSKDYGLKYTVIAQQALSLLGAAFLIGAWLIFLRSRKKYLWLWHLMGYAMVAIFVQSPTLMYYEQLIGPESPCIFVMCVLIFCVTGALYSHMGIKTKALLTGAALFVNLYLIYPMPKWIFVGPALEVVLLLQGVRLYQLPKSWKYALILMPLLLFIVLVYVPEHIHKIDRPSEDRTYIEYEQMAYTHFDLLARDKSNFPVPAPVQDSLVQYYDEAHQAEPGFLIGFNSDRLMWGKASDLVNGYYKNNYDSIGHFYKVLNFKLATKYPVSLAISILKQLGIFYFPTHYAHKNLCNYPNTKILYNSTRALLPQLDSSLVIRLRPYPPNPDLPSYFLSPRYPANMEQAGVTVNEKLPFVLTEMFWFFRWFDHIFLFVMCSFFITRYFTGRLKQLNLVGLFYLCIFIYACTIAIVHSFDIDRFIVTIFPFILVTTFMAMAEVGEEWLDWTLPFILKRLKK